MSDLPKWLVNPRDPNAPLDLAHDLRAITLKRVFCEQAGLDPATITDAQYAELVEELGRNKELLAIVEADTVEAAGLHDINADRAIQVLAVEANVSGLHAYHPMHYANVGAMLRDKLEDLDPERQQSEYYQLKKLVEVVLPWLETHGKEGLEALWRPGAKAKTRMALDILSAPLEAAGVTAASDADKPVPPELEAKIDQMMIDLKDPQVSARDFKQKHVVQAHIAKEMEALEAWDFKLPGDTGFIVLQYMGLPQLTHVERAVKAEWHLGTGKEGFIKLLKPKQVRSKGTRTARKTRQRK